MAQKYKRTKYLVAAKFQMKYVGLILLLVFLTGILCSYVVYYTSMLLFGDKLANVYPQGRLVSIIQTVNARMLMSLILVAPLVILIGIYISHKIAGPIYRMEIFLAKMTKGDFSSRLTLRKNDDLVSLADGINSVSESIKKTVKGQKALLNSAISLLEDLKREVEAKPINAKSLSDGLRRIEDELKGIGSELDRHKV